MADNIAIYAPNGTDVLGYVRTKERTTDVHNEVVEINVGGASESLWDGKVQLLAGTNAIGKLAANSGVDIGDVDVTSLPGIEGDVAHDAADSGKPVKIGVKAATALAAVSAAGDRANLAGDLLGRLLSAGIPPEMQKSKHFNDTSARAAGSATSALAPSSGKKLAIYGFTVSTYGTTAARVIFYLATSSDTTYTAGTDKPVFIGSFAPSATVKPGAVVMLPEPIYGAADDNVMYQNDAAISIDVVWHYWEF